MEKKIMPHPIAKHHWCWHVKQKCELKFKQVQPAKKQEKDVSY
jgi:hypothetical protein